MSSPQSAGGPRAGETGAPLASFKSAGGADASAAAARDRQPVQEVTRQEFDDAVSARPRGLLPAPRADPAAAEANGPLDLTQEAVDAAAAPIPSISSP